jgi:hypothetical protein
MSGSGPDTSPAARTTAGAGAGAGGGPETDVLLDVIDRRNRLVQHGAIKESPE